MYKSGAHVDYHSDSWASVTAQSTQYHQNPVDDLSDGALGTNAY